MHTYIHTYMHTYIHADDRPGREEDTTMLGQADARKDRPHTSQVRYLSRLSVQVPNGNQHEENHLARHNPRKEASPIRRPGVKYSSPAHYAHVKRPTRVQLPVLQPTNARLTPGRGTAFFKNSGDCSKRHAARIGTVSVTNAVTFTRTSADTRVGAIEHPQTPYPRILMDWVASPLRETQTRPRPLQRKF